jgi:hypothetical protein
MGGMLCLLCLCSMDNIVWRAFIVQADGPYSMRRYYNNSQVSDVKKI